MKFCPTCETRYDEEILRFCTKDGTPLIDEDQPNFTELPSETSETNLEDLSEETVVSYKPSKDLIEPEPQPDLERSAAPRIVISTADERREQNVRARQIPPYQQAAPPRQNTAKVVLLTVMGTLAALVVVLGMFLFLREDPAANTNINVNTAAPDMNLNTNLNLGASNFNLATNTNFNTNFNLPTNTNFNVNLNTNVNANLKTPTPKPSPSASANTNISVNTNVNNAPSPTPQTPPPTATATPLRTPTPARTPSPANQPSARPPVNSNGN